MTSNDALKMCKIKSSPMSEAVVERSVTVTISMSWHAHAASKLVTNSSCRLLQGFPDKISGMQYFKEILKAVDQATLCPEILIQNLWSCSKGITLFPSWMLQLFDTHNARYCVNEMEGFQSGVKSVVTLDRLYE